MGSRLIHLAVAKVVGEALGLDSNGFYFGNLIPDAHLPLRNSKEVAHFIRSTSKLSDPEFIKFNAFKEKYLLSDVDDMKLGYYCHLITDDLWLRTVYRERYLDNKVVDEADKQKKYYKNYGYLNEWLRKSYKLASVLPVAFEEIEEIEAELVFEMLEALENDLQSSNQEVEVSFFNEEDIRKFIYEASALVIEKIKNLEGEGQKTCQTQLTTNTSNSPQAQTIE